MQRLYKYPRTIGLAVFTLLSIIGLSITWYSYQNYRTGNLNELELVSDVLEQNIRKSLNNVFSASLTLALTLDSDGESQNFEAVAAQIIDRNPEIATVQLVPGGVIQQVYPLEGNEVVIGYDILEAPATRIEAEEAIRRREMFFAGPLNLKQGGVGVVGRLPVFINNAFWGFSAVIIDIDHLLKILNSSANQFEGYYFQFSKVDPVTGEEISFLETQKPNWIVAERTIQFREAAWELYLAKPGKFLDLIGIILLGVFSLGFGVVSSVFIKNLLKKPSELEELLYLKSADLLKSEERIRAMLAAIPDQIFIVNRMGRVIHFQKSPDQELFSFQSQIIDNNLWDLFPGELPEEIMKNIKETLAEEKVLVQEYTLDLPNGKKDYEARYVKINKNEVLIIVRNMTQRNKHINAIKRQNTKLKDIAWMQAHEVRGPLARMIGLIDIMQNMSPSDILPHDDIISNLLASASELDQIISKIIDEAQLIDES